MKKLLLILFITVCALSSCAKNEHRYSSAWSFDNEKHWKICEDEGCDSVIASAKHSFDPSSRTSDEDGQLIYSCTVCGYEKADFGGATSHIHNFSTAYISDSLYHWTPCSGCGEISTKEEHIWGENVILESPTSDAEGKAGRVCTVCKKYSVTTLDRLPEKMSLEEWTLAFEFDNLRIRESLKSGSFLAADSIYSVDGELVSVLNGGSTSYSSREVIAPFDLSEYYSVFSHYGNQIYKAKELEMSLSDGTLCRLKDITVIFENGRLLNIGYSMKMGSIFSSFTYSYDFYDWGEVELSPRRLTAEEVLRMLNDENFAGNLLLSCIKIDCNGRLFETELTLLDGEYICKYYTNGRFVKSKKGESAAAAREISAFLCSILKSEHIVTENFVYENDYDNFVYVGKPFAVLELGTLTTLELEISGSRISSLCVSTENGDVHSFAFTYK